MKKKRLSAAAGLTWRTGVLVFVLWFTAMSLLTVISAQQLQRKWVEYAMNMTSLHISDELQLPGKLETDRILGMWNFDFLGEQYLELPLYKDPAHFRNASKQTYTSYETATVFFKDGQPVMTQ